RSRRGQEGDRGQSPGRRAAAQPHEAQQRRRAGERVPSSSGPSAPAADPAPEAPVIGEDVLFASVRDLGQMLRTRKISSVELTEAYLGRLETIGPRLGAVVTVTRELALMTPATHCGLSGLRP